MLRACVQLHTLRFGHAPYSTISGRFVHSRRCTIPDTYCRKKKQSWSRLVFLFENGFALHQPQCNDSPISYRPQNFSLPLLLFVFLLLIGVLYHDRHFRSFYFSEAPNVVHPRSEICMCQGILFRLLVLECRGSQGWPSQNIHVWPGGI